MTTKEDILKYIWKIEDSSEISELWNMLKAKSKQLRGMEVFEFNVGEKVEWTRRHSGEIRKGKIIKLNQTSISVDADDGSKWRVAPSLLRKGE